MFASKNATPGTVLATLVLCAIIEIENAGGFVDGLTCDGGSNNRRMWTEFGISGKLNVLKSNTNMKNIFASNQNATNVSLDDHNNTEDLRSNETIVLNDSHFIVNHNIESWDENEKKFFHYFKNPVNDNRKIYLFSDVPHLIKCIRNRLLDQDLWVCIEKYIIV